MAISPPVSPAKPLTRRSRVMREPTDERRDHDEREGLDPLRSPGDRAPACGGHAGARIAPDQGVRRAGRNAVEPGDQIPDYRAEQSGENQVGGDDVRPDDSLLDRFCHQLTSRESGCEVEEGYPYDG